MPGHGGRSRPRRASRSARALVAIVFSLALAPSVAGAQLSFVVTERIESRLIAVAQGPAASFGAATAGAHAPSVAEAAPAAEAAPTVAEAAPPRDMAVRLAERTVELAERYVGTRYRWGGASPNQGFDCSGFVRYVFGQQGIDLPRVARLQARAGRPVSARLDDLRPGDLLFFAQRGPGVDHVAIYAGEGRIIHASRRGYGVRYDDLTGARGRWYARRIVSVRRVIEPPADSVTIDAGAAEEAAPLLGEPVEPVDAPLLGEPVEPSEDASAAAVLRIREAALPGVLEAGS